MHDKIKNRKQGMAAGTVRQTTPGMQGAGSCAGERLWPTGDISAEAKRFGLAVL